MTHVQHQLLVAINGHPGGPVAASADGRVVRIRLTRAGDRLVQQLTQPTWPGCALSR